MSKVNKINLVGNRSRVGVIAYNKLVKNFNNLVDTITSMEAKIESLKEEINSLEDELLAGNDISDKQIETSK